MAAKQPIPVFTNLTDLHGTLGSAINHAERWNNLTTEFKNRFGRTPTYIARAPGRVNLIGEHIDYALFGVLPAAVEQDILIACAPRHDHPHPGHVVADNLHHKYTRQTFAPSMFKNDKGAEEPTNEEVHVERWHLDINSKQLKWESYVKAGYYGVLNHYFAPSSGEHPIPVDLLITGSVPAGSGLSSSAAMVVASTLAFLAVNGKLEGENRLDKGQLVQIAVENEKRVGVNSGGMDQAASVISLPSSALYISFFSELDATPVKLPSQAVFVCANSLVVSDKVVTARFNYNLRVVETLVGARILANKLDVKLGPKERITFREVIGRAVNEPAEGLDVPGLRKAIESATQQLGCLKGKDEVDDNGVTLEEMISMSGMSEADFNQVYLSWINVEATHYKLYRRGKHILSEALRVLKFKEICDESSGSNDVLQRLGELMNGSQTSCSTDYQCSCPELDELTKLACESGAYGSRLTGAGWGGCTVSLVAESEVESFMQKIKEGYAPFRNLQGEALREVLFATKPSTGACVYKFE